MSIRLPVAEPPVVLAVDDDPNVRTILAEELGYFGYSVLPTASGAEALAALERQHIDGMILDLVLPDMHGCELILRLKGWAERRHVAILVITGANVDAPQLEVLNRFAIPVLEGDRTGGPF